MLSVNSIDTAFVSTNTWPHGTCADSALPKAPREEWEAVSVAQTGVMAFRTPVPTPLNTRAQNIQFADCALV